MKRSLQSALMVAALVVARGASAQEVVAEPAVKPQSAEAPPAATPVAGADAPPAAKVETSRAIGGRGRVVLDLAGASRTSGAVVGVGGLPAIGALGGHGTFAFVGPFSFVTSSFGDSRYVRVALAPSADFFVTDRLSLGGSISASYASQDRVGPGYVGAVSVGAIPRMGYAFPLSSTFAFWPRLGAGVDVSITGSDRSVVPLFLAEANLGFTGRLTKNFLVDLGPVVAFRHADSAFGASNILDAGGRMALRLDF